MVERQSRKCARELRRYRDAPFLCVPKTLSELMTRWNRLSWRNDRAALFRANRPGLAIQVEIAAENAVLRHQLLVLRRRLHGRIRLRNNDRWFFIQLYRWFRSILKVLTT